MCAKERITKQLNNLRTKFGDLAEFDAIEANLDLLEEKHIYFNYPYYPFQVAPLTYPNDFNPFKFEITCSDL